MQKPKICLILFVKVVNVIVNQNKNSYKINYLNVLFQILGVAVVWCMPDKMSTEQFCLRWNDFHTNITSAFSDIRDDDEFLDVTLVSTFLLIFHSVCNCFMNVCLCFVGLTNNLVQLLAFRNQTLLFKLTLNGQCKTKQKLVS